MIPNGMDIVRISERSKRAPRTVERVYRGQGNHYSRQAVTEAAQELGLPLPPSPAPMPSSPPSSSSSPTPSLTG